MELNLGRIGNWFSDRLVVQGEQEGALTLRIADSWGDWITRIVSWICSPSEYSEENRKSVSLFQKIIHSAIGEDRLRRIGTRYGVDFDKLQESGSPLLSRDVAKILTGIQDVKIEDMEELIHIANGEIEEWPGGIDPALRDLLIGVENSGELDKDTFNRIYSALKKPIAADVELPNFNRHVHGGMPTEDLACLYFDPLLADQERLFLCEKNPGEDFESFAHDFSARIIHREMEVGMLVPAPGVDQFYRVAAKIVSGEGLVSYCLIPATQDTDLPPVRFYRGTSARPCSIDSMSTIITDMELDLGERAFRSGEKYDRILEEEFPFFEVQAGHSLGSTILQKNLVEESRIKTAYLFNGPGITEREVLRFNERVALDPDPVKLIIRDAGCDTICLVGNLHLGYRAPEGVVNYIKYGPTYDIQQRSPGYVHTTVWLRETKYFGIDGVEPDEMLDRKKVNESNEYWRSTVGPSIAKIFLIVRDCFRWAFGSRADEQKGIQLGRFIEGRWKVDHLRP